MGEHAIGRGRGLCPPPEVSVGHWMAPRDTHFSLKKCIKRKKQVSSLSSLKPRGVCFLFNLHTRPYVFAKFLIGRLITQAVNMVASCAERVL
jgi:hypothetical protein